MTRTSRRSFLFLAAGGALLAEDRPKRDMLVRSTRPEDLEMPLSGFADYITPIEHFFVRTHVYVPTVNPAEWRLKVEGEVAAPLTLTLNDVKQLPAVELVSVVECAGNGRGFYEPPVAGLQWMNGSVGNGRWRGARLADVLKKAGIKDSAVEVLFDGADVPIGAMPDFQRSIPVKKALDPNTLLAYSMNGEALPEKHGFPLRVITAGWASDSWVKWLTSIRVLDKPSDSFWMKNTYRHPGKAVTPGTAVPPEQMQPVTSLHVKSVIAMPAEGSQAQIGKPVTIQGAAWSGDSGPVTAVDVSTDGGRTWRPAKLGRDQDRFGWRLWELAWTPQRDGYQNILARARDAGGDSQPLVQEWNPSGYSWNVAPRVGVNVTSTPGGEIQPIAAPPTAAQPAAFRNACMVCHEEDVIRQQRLDRAGWDRELNKMTGWGAQVTPENRETFLNYLLTNFGPRPRGR